MKNYFLFIISVLFFINTSFAQEQYSKDLLLISSLRNYETDAHIEFQKELYLSSDNFIKNKSEEFVDNETGFFKLWSEVFSPFESDTKRNARWKNRVEKYFRATEYISHIKAKENSYAETINTQREELLGKLHLKNNELTLKNKEINATSVSPKEITKVVNKVNNLVLIEVIPEVIESLLVPVIISLIAMIFGILLAGKTKGIIFVIALIVSVCYSFRYSNELESQINESFAQKDKQHLIILPDLNKNTTLYYEELITKIK